MSALTYPLSLLVMAAIMFYGFHVTGSHWWWWMVALIAGLEVRRS